MPWLELKNGLLLKLASILQFLAARIAPEVHAPGLQEDAHLPMEDDLSAFSNKSFKVSRPSEDSQKEDWRKRAGELSVGDVSAPIGGRVERKRSLFTERLEADEPARTIAERQPGITPALDHDKHSWSSQQPQSLLIGLHPKAEMPAPEMPKVEIKDRAGSVTEIGVPQQAPSGVEWPAELLRKRVFEHQEMQTSTTAADVSIQHLGEFPEQSQTPKPKSSKRGNANNDPWLSQMMRKIATSFRPATQPPVSQVRTAATTMASTGHAEPPAIFAHTDVYTKDLSTSEDEPQAHQAMVYEQEYCGPSSANNGIKTIKSAAAVPFRLPRRRLSLPDETETAALRDENNAPETTAQRLLRRQRETAAPVVPWPNPGVRVITTETEHWSFPLPTIFGEPNLTTAATSSWKGSPDQENAPGLPALPSEFRPSAENSGAIYPWPELPQIVEEDPDEPRKLLQNHERQMRVLREQRGSW